MNLNLNVRHGNRKTESVDLLQTPTAVSYQIVPRDFSEISTENLEHWEAAMNLYLTWVRERWPKDSWLFVQEKEKLEKILSRVLRTKDFKKKKDRVIAEFFVM